jgi:hypothetical protein
MRSCVKRILLYGFVTGKFGIHHSVHQSIQGRTLLPLCQRSKMRGTYVPRELKGKWHRDRKVIRARPVIILRPLSIWGLPRRARVPATSSGVLGTLQRPADCARDAGGAGTEIRGSPNLTEITSANLGQPQPTSAKYGGSEERIKDVRYGTLWDLATSTP